MIRHIIVIATLVASPVASAVSGECLTREEAARRWPEGSLVATREIEEIGKKGGLEMGFFIEDNVLVVNPDPGGAASIAGIKKRDRVLAIDGRKIGDFPNDAAIVAALRGKPGTRVRLSVERNGKTSVIRVTRKEVESVDFRYCFGPDPKFV